MTRNTIIGTFMAALPLTFSASLAACTEAKPDPIIEFRIAKTSPAAGLQPMLLDALDSTFYVSDSISLSDDDLANVKTSFMGKELVLRMTLTPDGAARLKETTSSHVGDRLALLLGSRLLKAPKIMEGVGGTDFTVGVELPKGAADQVAASIAERWPQS